MNDSILWDDSHQTDTVRDADAVRDFLTSVKQVRRRDGRMDAFDRTKIERSIAAAARAYGLDEF